MAGAPEAVMLGEMVRAQGGTLGAAGVAYTKLRALGDISEGDERKGRWAAVADGRALPPPAAAVEDDVRAAGVVEEVEEADKGGARHVLARPPGDTIQVTRVPFKQLVQLCGWHTCLLGQCAQRDVHRCAQALPRRACARRNRHEALRVSCVAKAARWTDVCADAVRSISEDTDCLCHSIHCVIIDGRVRGSSKQCRALSAAVTSRDRSSAGIAAVVLRMTGLALECPALEWWAAAAAVCKAHGTKVRACIVRDGERERSLKCHTFPSRDGT
mmetsp:Transcript_26329/g.52865  ORF Transcript_26329/g.52865 Transcript_26329/m.52865 type:complete len:272 (-) Transcript_26329:422-1237(-)